MTTIYQNYRKEILAWDWSAIVESAYNNVEADYDGNTIGRDYLGSILHLTPSGKVYTPFANSNVDACPTCKGSGKARKAHNCLSCRGVGQRSVLGLSRIRQESIKDTLTMLEARDSKVYFNQLGKQVFNCFSCSGKGKVYNDCPTCGGLGSLEAYQDQEWQQALDDIAELHGGYIESGEGDACDLFFCLSIDDTEEGDTDD